MAAAVPRSQGEGDAWGVSVIREESWRTRGVRWE